VPVGGRRSYRLAQLDDYGVRARKDFAHRSINLELSARVSARAIAGTWGFGLWNDPFVVSISDRGRGVRLPALPNAAWFFHSSPESHLSFTDGKPANGLLAQVFRSPRFDGRLLPAAMLLPVAPRAARRVLGRLISEDAASVELDATQWHRYRVRWSDNTVEFSVDEAPVLTTSVIPKPPLGLVIWIDNQYARFTPQGRIGFGTLASDQPAWLELKVISVGIPEE
jgi:hypothetical protein